ncbi:RNA-binding transcriptional accessory protein [Dolosigranulum pigrum]|uniref:RNA-binding transcriptional accessory protein n=1 Tax=Dolosigranulum pigrum TaxID=29394 RepID=A0A516GG85_9LACT|nr:Tex family protein [Dolosigranulum pigrum]QDO90531.1 RNA-binding transcriptional accessory protein [Dolosigranulum pigrum]QTJ43937.1 RNA-binding transcriptional accessory protein [Dolosigranulum pigrum]QTJ47361.1 RNA-binding transcriptional accessory protein [Dolosigranulum pigrum]QTJ60867.1 RNA-binding transcriptional accessory protein [Dolosigranulum pigrum]RAN56875.1 RNA-binding transcriptional accessory protein [Dolosigranulum pigrum]
MEDKQTFQLIVRELSDYSTKQVRTVLSLLDDGNTVPFIARYRKDQTGALDEVQIREIQQRSEYIQNLQDRKETVLSAIEEQGELTDELAAEIREATQLQEVEDLYRPYKKKRQTLATKAKEAGLEPLADWLLGFPDASEAEIEAVASDYLNSEYDVETVADALAGAHEIIAEQVADNPEYRKRLRDYTIYNAQITSTVKNEEIDEKNVFQQYYEYAEDYRKIAPHRTLALNRGESEEVLTVKLEVGDERAHRYLYKQILPSLASSSPIISIVKEAIKDAYKRFIAPSIERELRSTLTEKAETHAIQIFGENLKNLLMQAPLKQKTILGLDPAYRSGCKLAVIDSTGKVLAIKVIYPHTSGETKRNQSKEALKQLITEHAVDVIAIGNGTASRESEQFVAEVVSEMPEKTAFIIVNEAGASVYSASDEARREFPDLAVEERSAISIARRLQDPLAELVKIDPKSIGVGQYQHDVSQKELEGQLDFVVETAVNQVGVNLNTASGALLEHVSGLTKTAANNIVAYRESEGQFTTRDQIKQVKRLGPKSYQQAVGFLRIPDAPEPFDQTGIHPESYTEAEKILAHVKQDKSAIGSDELKHLLEQLPDIQTAEQLEIGLETYRDIVAALIAPGRDARDDMPAPILSTDVLKMDDLREGMQLQGTVRNVVDFGAFVDIGVKEDGLVHISELSDQFVEHPKDVVQVGDIVTVWIKSIDLDRSRIGLTMIQKD